MTSAEFAGKYRLLKNVAERGARTFLAQQTALGRMVMVHYLDAGSAADRQMSLTRLQSLRPAAREKVLEITDVDGVPVAVTLYITSFGDLSTWLEQNLDSPKQDLPSAPPAPVGSFGGDFTRAFGKMAAPQSAPEQPAAQPVASAPPAEGEFTRQFGKVGTPPPSDLAPVSRPAAAAPAPQRDPIKPPVPQSAQPDDADEPTLIIEAVKPPAPPPPKPAPAPIAAAPAPPQPVAPPPPAPSAPSQGEFTRLFSGIDAGSMPGAAKDVRSAPPAAPPPPMPVAPPLAAPRPIAAEQSRAPAPEKPAAPPRQQESAFTALFGKIDAAPPAASPFPSSFESVNPSPALPSALPPMAPAGKAGMVMPPVSPVADLPAPVASAPPPPPPAGGEFTQLFQRLTPTAVPPGQSEAEIARSFEPTKRADFAAPSAPPPTPVRPLGAVPPSAPPPMGGGLQAPPLAPPKPMGAAAASAPLFGAPAASAPPSPALPGANRGGSVMPSSDGPSEFTRVLGRVQAPASSQSGQTPAAAPAPAAQAPAAAEAPPASSLKKYLPWIIVANVVLIAVVVLVVYLVMKK